jgi:hypothetical protein
MTPTPHHPPPHPASAGPPKRARWIVPVAAGGAVALACCIGAAVLVASGGDDDRDRTGRAAGPTSSAPERTTAVEAPDESPEPEPPPAPAPEPVGFAAGIWQVGAEIPAGTYVTTAPGGGAFDSCYWARLSGFSGDLEEIVANGNLNAGARGRVTISDTDAGVELSGGCRWVGVAEAEPAEINDEVGEGVWAVGDEIPPGTYVTDAPAGSVLDSCYWARLSGFTGELDDIIANGNLDAGTRGRIDVSSSDAGIELTGECVWSRS